MYIVIGGTLEYDSVHFMDQAVTVGAHICELALCIDWTTLGLLEASASRELLKAADAVMKVLAVCSKRKAIAEFAAEFSAKLCQAIEAEHPQMTDLWVGMDFDAVVASMHVASRSLISERGGRGWKTLSSRSCAANAA